jgi:glycosyltransferase involved in cell wall biosynthesis
MAARLVEAGISAERVYVKPNCVSTSVRCSDVSKQDYVVYSGRLSVEKGLLTLFHAWRQLPQIPLKVIGDGPLRAELEAVVRQYHLPIQLLGYLPPLEAQKIVAAAKLQVVPSQWFEGMPLVVLEAWSLGTTVLASRIGGLGEMISDGVDGVLFKPGNSADLASQVQLLMSDSELRARLARAARDAVETRFSSHATLDSLTQVYSDVVRR